jgi:hypothetical protein
MLHHQQAHEDLSGSESIAPCEVGAHLLLQLIILEQTIELHEYGVGLVSQFGHTTEHILRIIAVDEHGGASLPLTGSTSFYRQQRR